MSRVCVFFGADHKCGVSMLSQCVAERISELEPDMRILLLHAHGLGGRDFSSSTGESFEALKPYLSRKLIDADEVLKKSLWRGNIHVIGCAEEVGSASAYHPDMVRGLIESLGSSLDLILCDSGADPEHGLSLGALLACDAAYIVLSQDESALGRCEKRAGFFSDLRLNIAGFVVNKFDRNSSYTLRYIAERLGEDADMFCTVRFSEHGRRAETDGRSIISFSGGGFKRDIDELSYKLLDEAWPEASS